MDDMMTSSEEPTSDGEVFRYSLLEDDHIRLLLIKEAPSTDDTLLCEMTTAKLPASGDDTDSSNLPSFTALSYVWGDPAQNRTVWIGSKKLAITANLETALIYLRQRDEPRMVWADSVCINQDDVAERNHQVHRMHTIYSSAAKTIVYLGGNHQLNTCFSAWNFLDRESERLRNPRSEKFREQDSRIDFRGDLEDVEIAVLERDYFRRVWVLQEVSVSKNIFVQCGSRTIAWDDFCRVILLESRTHDHYGFSLRKRGLYEYLSDMFQTRCSYLAAIGDKDKLPYWYDSIIHKFEHRSSLLHTISRARRLRATDPRDKIFALFGISTDFDNENELIAIDYSKSVSAIYTNYCKYHIDTSKNYDILSHAIETRFDMKLPSWVPDWSYAPFPSCLISSILRSEDDRVRDKRMAQVEESHIWDHSSPGLLRCSGRIIGEITHYGQEIRIKGVDERTFEEIRTKHESDEKTLNQRILEIWSKFGYLGSKTPDLPPPYTAPVIFSDSSADSDEDDSMIPTRRIPSFQHRRQESGTSTTDELNGCQLEGFDFDDDKEIRIGAIEENILKRSRRTIQWTNDESKAGDAIIDRHSVMDGRKFASLSYSTAWEEIEKGLALVPSSTRAGDMMISIKGARLPFIANLGPVDSDEKRTWRGKLRGECLVNDFERFDSINECTENEDGSWDDEIFLIE